MAQTAWRTEIDQLDSTRLSIGLLGPLVVIRDGRDLEVAGPKRRALLSLLALHAGRPLGRDQIIEALWPRRHTGKEESTLRTHVSYLRDGIEPNREQDPVVLITRGQSYMLSAEHVELDTDRFHLLAEEGRDCAEGQPAQALALFDEALGLWRGRPLQDVEYEDFAQDEVRNLGEARFEVVAERARTHVALGNLGAAVSALEPLAREKPDWEEPAITLMYALYGSGRHSDSLGVARRHRRHLARRGLEPSPRMIRVEDQILNHDPDLITGVRPTGAEGNARGYELREEAGEGSLGVVYRAFQASVGREVAVKVVHPDLAGSAEFVRRFAEEAKVVGSLEHPHIVPLYDFWRDPSGAFLVMRWMGGGGLDARLGPGWTASEMVRVFDQVADALSYAHSAGLVHRDVKPSNVLFDDAGNAYLSDFGLATWGVETYGDSAPSLRPPARPHASSQELPNEGPTVASDISALGSLLAGVSEWLDEDEACSTRIAEVVRVATAVSPADRYPDAEAFRRALVEAVGNVPMPSPRRIRRNPYKGLKAFDEGDAADFYGRDDFIERLLEATASRSLVAVVAASGTGKSSVVKAGLIPETRAGAIPGSDEWFVVTMVPGIDPFEEFRVALRAAAMSDAEPAPHRPDQELRGRLAASFEAPSSKALLVIDQFEELFSSDVDPTRRERFLDNLVDLATDPSRRVKTVMTLRADFSDTPLSHPRFGGLLAKATLMLGPMTAQELEDVIRLPASRVGMEVEPGLVSEIIRDLSDAPASLPMLQYILSELVERRTEDRLTVHAYRSLGGIRGVLERQAEASFTALPSGARSVCRQVFLRMVQLGEHREETRRRVARSELSGLGDPGAIDEVVAAFTSARIITSDRDPVSRVPTIEVSHETVISRWTRFRVWIDESWADVSAQRRLAAAADTWVKSGESPEFLLTGGPLSAAVELANSGRVTINDTETRFVESSRQSATEAAVREQKRQEHEADLEHRSRRRLAVGIGAVAIAAVVAVLGGVAWFERQRADDLAATQERQSQARELAAASGANLAAADPDLSLLLAIEAADLSLEAGEEVLPEVVDALHHAVMRPRPLLIIRDALGDTNGDGVSYSNSGIRLAYVTDEETVAVVTADTGTELLRTDYLDPPVKGVDFNPLGDRVVMSIHRDGAREWDVASGELTRWFPHTGVVTTATYSDDGRMVAMGDQTGTITVYGAPNQVVAVLTGEHEGSINSVDFDPEGTRLVSAGSDPRVIVWDLGAESVSTSPRLETEFCVHEASWHPTEDEIVVTLCQGEAFAIDATTGARVRPFSANQTHTAMVYDISGSAVVGAGADGFTRFFNTGFGGSSVFELPNGGAPLSDVEFNPRDPSALEVAALGLDGVIQVWRHGAAWSELPHLFSGLLYPYIDATPDGSYYVFGANSYIKGWPHCDELSATAWVVETATERVLAMPETYCSLGLRRQAAISDDGRLVAVTGRSGQVTLLDVEAGTSEEIPDSVRWALDLDFSSDAETLAGVGADGLIAVWDVETKSRIRTMAPGLKALDSGQRLLPDRGLFQVEFLPESEELVTAGFDGSVRLWNTGNGTNRIIQVFDFWVNSIDVSSDGATVVAADSTGDVRLIDVATGEERLPRPQGVPGSTRVVFSPDDRYLAGGGPGPEVNLWKVETGEIVRRIGRAIGPPTVAFVNGGAEIRAASAEGIIRGYVLDPLELLRIAKEIAGRPMTEEECQRYLGKWCQR